MSFTLLESGDKILLESGDRLLLEWLMSLVFNLRMARNALLRR